MAFDEECSPCPPEALKLLARLVMYSDSQKFIAEPWCRSVTNLHCKQKWIVFVWISLLIFNDLFV